MSLSGWFAELAWFVLGAGMAGLAAWLWATARARGRLAPALREAELRASAVTATAEALRSELADWKTRAAEGQLAVQRLEGVHAAERARASELERSLGEQRRLLDEAKAQMGDTFEALAAEALRESNAGFLRLATAHLATTQQAGVAELAAREKAIAILVDPVRSTLEKFDLQVHALERARGDAYTRLTEQVRALAEGQRHLQAGTDSLVGALRAPAVRGRWGEIQLRRVMEIAGMLDHCDFAEQASIQTIDGRLRPDVIVRLPGNKCVVVDAKAPLGAYLNAREATTDEARRELLRQHASQVKSHVLKLGAKNYWDHLETSPEIVILFLPGDAFYAAALEAMPDLLEEALAHRVLLATPTTLIGVLQAIHVGWRHEQLAENAAHISRCGRDLHERLATFTEHMARMGGALERSVEAFNSATASLDSRVMPSARRLEELGAGGKKELPELAPIDKRPRSLPATPKPPVSIAVPIRRDELRRDDPQDARDAS